MEKILHNSYREQIIFLLSQQEGEYISGDRICDYIGISRRNKAILRTIINKMRIDGTPILSSSRGYKLSNDLIEIETCIIDLKNRARSILMAAHGMEDYVDSNYNRLKAEWTKQMEEEQEEENNDDKYDF